MLLMSNWFFRLVLFVGLVISAALIGSWLQLYDLPAIWQLRNLKSQSSPTQNISTQDDHQKIENVILIIGDTGTGDQRQAAVATAIGSYCELNKNCEFGIIAGDVIYNDGVKSTDDPQFESKFARFYEPLQLPWYIALGNHDYRGCVDCYLKPTTAGSTWNHPSRYYAIAVSNNFRFLIIDTEQFNQQQQEWLSSELEKAQQQKIVVVGHRPIESFEHTKRGEDWSGRQQLKDLICNKAELYVAGHAHDMEDVGKLPDCSVRQVISGGGGAEPRVVDEVGVPFGVSANGFLVLRLNQENKQITGEFFDTQSKLLHTFSSGL